MPNIYGRLDNIERKQEGLSMRQPSYVLGNADFSDEISLLELFSIIWKGKWWALGTTLVLGIIGALYAKGLPNLYKSEGVYAASQDDGGGSIPGQFGGLAAMAGIKIGGGKNSDVDQAIALMTSWPFLERIVEENSLAPYVLGWNPTTRKLIWDSSVYDDKTRKWIVSDDVNERIQPTSYQVYVVLREILEVTEETGTGMIKISIYHYSPEVSAEWVKLLVREINKHFQQRDIVESTKNIAYLNEKISETSIAEMKRLFFGMVESQMKTLMLAEVGDEYLFKEIVPPKIAEYKSKPSRVIILAPFPCCWDAPFDCWNIT